MSEVVVLRRVYAVDSNTGGFLSSGQVLVTNNVGGTNWMDANSSLSVAGGPIVGYLPSTISTFSTLTYQNTSSLSTFSYEMYNAISTLGLAISNITPGNITPLSFQDSTISTTAGLGSAGYFSTSGISSLSTLGFIVIPQLISTIDGLGSLGYISTGSLISTNLGFSESGATVSSASVTSSIDGLGLVYPSTQSMTSSLSGLGSIGYISTQQLVSTVRGLGSATYVSSPQLTSSIQGLGNFYISTASLVSTVESLSTFANTCVRFDRTVNAYVQNCTVIFTSTNSLGFFSTFTQSSVTLTQTFGVQQAAEVESSIIMKFSTVSIDLDPFANFMTQSSIVTLDVYPHIAFSRLSESATNVAVLPISTFVAWNSTILTSPMVTTFLYAGNTTTTINSIQYSASNFYNSPIKLQFPPATIPGSTMHKYTLFHIMPNGITAGANTNALSNQNYTPYFGTTGSVFVSIQNLV